MAFRYRLEYATRTKLVSPKDPVKIVVAKEQEEAFFREKLTGSVTLTNEDYQFLRDAETYAVECCQEITFVIERTCEEEIFWEGYFTLYNVSWNHDNQEAVINKITVRDKYNVVFANWHKEINWFGDISPRRPAAPYIPIHPLQTFYQTTPTSTEYNPNGSNVYDRGFYFNYAILWLIQQTLSGSGSESYSDITQEQMSDFLTAPVNPANGKPNYLRDVLLMHISDAKRPAAFNPAWIGKVTLRDVLSNLKLLYNAWWYIDENNHFRIEHVSYFKNFSYTPVGVTLDLTEEQFTKNMVGKNKYSYNADDLNGREGVDQTLTSTAFDQKSQIWTQFANPSLREFSSVYMSYPDSCVPKDDKGVAAEKYQNISLFTTDWRTVTYKPDTVPEQGWMLAHVVLSEASTGVQQGWVPITNEYYPNGALSMSRLFYEFGRTDLSFQYGMMTFEKESKPASPDPDSDYVTARPMRAKSTKRIKLFEPVDLPMCCGDDYDFSGIIKHPLDDETYVQRIEFDLAEESVSATLIATNDCDTIPFPEYVEIEEPTVGCIEQGRLLRSEEQSTRTDHTPINYVYITVYIDYFADGECGEYYSTRESRRVTPKRGNGPR
jgi:hypothetical protein